MIRRAQAGDADALTALMHASSAYRGNYARILQGYAVTPDQIARDHVYLATDANGALAGFYSLTLQPEPELDLMFVADAAQGTGLGRALFAHFRALAASLGVQSVLIVSHPPALGFYQRQGAVRTATKPPTDSAPWERPILRLEVQSAG